MGLAVAHDLVRQGHRVTVADVNERCLQALPSLAEAVDVVHLDAGPYGEGAGGPAGPGRGGQRPAL